LSWGDVTSHHSLLLAFVKRADPGLDYPFMTVPAFSRASWSRFSSVYAIARSGCETCRTMPELKDKMTEIYGKIPVQHMLYLSRASGASLMKHHHAACAPPC
jgi:hypothetical protein